MFSHTLSQLMIRLALVVGAWGLFVPSCEDWALAAPPAQESPAATTHAFRASDLAGLTVRNPAGEELGTVEDLMLDVRTGRIDYAILSHGGLFGLGDKLFPIPWREMSLHHAEDGMHFVVDASPQFLRRLPSFDREHWPDSTEGWSELVESMFPIHTGRVVSVTEDRLVMALTAGGAEHSHAVALDAHITRDGEPAHLLDLQPGDRVRVTTEEQGGLRAITKIEAHAADTTDLTPAAKSEAERPE